MLLGDHLIGALQHHKTLPPEEWIPVATVPALGSGSLSSCLDCVGDVSRNPYMDSPALQGDLP